MTEHSEFLAWHWLHSATRRVPSWLHIWSLLCSPCHICNLAGDRKCSRILGDQAFAGKEYQKTVLKHVSAGTLAAHSWHCNNVASVSSVSTSIRQGNTLVTNLQNYQACVCDADKWPRCYNYRWYQVLVTVVDIGFTFEEVFASSSKVYEMISASVSSCGAKVLQPATTIN